MKTLFTLNNIFSFLYPIIFFFSSTSEAISGYIPEGNFKKYNAALIDKIVFDSEEALDLLRRKYHSFPEPDITVNIKNGEDLKLNALLKISPKFMIWNNNKDFFIVPNPKYYDHEKVKTSKVSPIALVGWHAPASEESEGDDSISKFGNLLLRSLLDINPSHLPLLEEIKKMAIKQLYDLPIGSFNEENVLMYFHFPYPKETSSLHLHVKVNQAIHPLEIHRSYQLDDVINHLKEGKSGIDLIWTHHRKYDGLYVPHSATKDLNNIEGLDVKSVENPFQIEEEMSQNFR